MQPSVPSRPPTPSARHPPGRCQMTARPFPAAKGAQHPQIEVQRGHRRGHSGPAGSPARRGPSPSAARTCRGGTTTRHRVRGGRCGRAVRPAVPAAGPGPTPLTATIGAPPTSEPAGPRHVPEGGRPIAEPPGHHPTCGADRSCRDHRHRPGAPDGARGISIRRKRNSASPHRPAGEQPVNEPRRRRPRPGVVVGSAEWPSCRWSPKVMSRSPRNAKQ